MSDKPTNLAVHTGDATLWSVEQMLENSLSDVRDGARTHPKAIVLFLDDDDDYRVGYSQAGMSCSQILALLEVTKTMVLEQMGFLESK